MSILTTLDLRESASFHAERKTGHQTESRARGRVTTPLKVSPSSPSPFPLPSPVQARAGVCRGDRTGLSVLLAYSVRTRRVKEAPRQAPSRAVAPPWCKLLPVFFLFFFAVSAFAQSDVNVTNVVTVTVADVGDATTAQAWFLAGLEWGSGIAAVLFGFISVRRALSMGDSWND